MKQINSDDQKPIILDILKDIDMFCNKNNIRYSLGYGTLLGAVRHKGFIPWDDDIDILMPRPDYNRFINLFKTENDNNDRKFVTINNYTFTEGYYYPYVKVTDERTLVIENNSKDICKGLFVDIFPIDGLPENQDNAIKFIDKCKKIKDIWSLKMLKLSNCRWTGKIYNLILKTRYSFLPLKDVVAKIDKTAQSYDYDSSNYVGAPAWGYTHRDRFEKKLFEDYTKLSFEGYEFWSISNYELYLTQIYGDYMKLPPIEQQKNYHGFTCYWR